ncbi:hypothetical protein LTR96_002940 [Exophiala xenobiotica]|nr:hypothetical protein LTR92_005192 [Exophiala xenobiotica]KAK5273308.1 hypothetical protein LTR96_002940 [Exophiala xenobiotica]KAK5341019.1 hypothetical protein LTR98_001811 [Exophiala xenobiotica]KAK5443568.1 hypothetical protein LTR18_004829 [Exophiala xenobiotica]
MAKSSIIIVGAGPVGLFLALRLTQLGIRVTVLERDESNPPVPRALGYFGAAMFALQRAGIWEAVRDSGPTFGDLGWRKLAKDKPDGSKAWGDEIAYWNIAATTPYKKGEPGWGMVIMGQDQLRAIMLPRIKESGLADFQWGYGLKSLTQDETAVTIQAVNSKDEEKIFTADFVVAADGGKSQTRKQLGIKLDGFTWPEIIISSDVRLDLEIPGRTGVNYIIDPVNWGFFCPLEHQRTDGPTLYRVTFPVSDKEMEPEVFEATVRAKFDITVPGPRPLKYEVVRQTPYRVHQRLATTMNVGRVCLVGDAAHLNAPWGAFGLTTGLLDSESLADALEYIIKDNKPLSILQTWSEARRKAFSAVSNPISTANKLRCSNLNPETAAEDDAFLKAIVSNDQEALARIAGGFQDWRTNMSELLSY